MIEDLLTQQNPHWVGESWELGVTRSCFERLLTYLSTGQVVAITGVRRSGKSTLLRQLIDHLVKNEAVAAKNILFLNLEHPNLTTYREESTGLQRLYETYLKLMQPEDMIYVCLDEAQFFREWPIFVKAHYEMKKVRFVVTGSNAAMLSSDLMTLLSGRSLPLEVFPFSFREYVQSRGIDLTKPEIVAQQTPRIRHLLDELLEYGGFPSVALQPQHQAAFEILGAYARTVLLQDVVPRLGIRKPADLEKLYVYLASNIGKLFSYSGLSSLFSLSDKSLKEYLRALVDSYLLFELDRFSYSLKSQVRNPKKVYAIDTGQANAMGFSFSANRGRLLENAILVDMKRLGLETYYYRTAADREIDFVVKNRNEISLVQVAWDLNELGTRQRELKALQEAMQELSCNRGIIVAAVPTPPIEALDVGVEVISAHQYLLLEPEDRKRRLFP